MKILFIGDIVGKPGRQAVKVLLPNIVSRYKIDSVIANGENAAGGFGITEPTAKELFSCGIEILTTGNHVWDKKEAIPYLIKEQRILRPLNYPPEVPGIGSVIFKALKKFPVAVLNISGRIFMNTLDCPFRTAKIALQKIVESAKIIIIDFHAEATSEKLAFAYYVDGKVSAVIGTHTHVQTADERILPGGTAYITDVGMTGPSGGVIGIEKEEIIDKFLTHMPRKFNVAEGKAVLSAVVIEIDEQSGKASGIQRIQLTNP
ncbi:MAG TPA: TIGR00282 family metallophosphoesterase [Dissulfurispiraceae bacterium]|nr:TIGR00282 family metallophosphoesterase [Dissulfurispiraceae bacterium]